jgi:hypothetical protein
VCEEITTSMQCYCLTELAAQKNASACDGLLYLFLDSSSRTVGAQTDYSNNVELDSARL